MDDHIQTSRTNLVLWQTREFNRRYMCLLEIRLTYKYNKKRLVDMTCIKWSVALHRRRFICKKLHLFFMIISDLH